MERRPIGNTDIMVSPVAFGGWPITGITNLDVDESNSVASWPSPFKLIQSS